MHLIGIFFLFCVSFGTVSPWFWNNLSWPPWGSTDPTDAIITDVCSYFAQHPDSAAIAIQKLNATLQSTPESQQTFVLTIAYINTPSNQQKLTGGTDTCKSFFSDLRNDIIQDWNNRNLTSNTGQQTAADTLKNFKAFVFTR